MDKCRSAHSNISKLQLRTHEAANSVPMSNTHKDLLDKIKKYNEDLITMVRDYTHVVTSHSLPNIKEPTTTELLRKKIVQDLGIVFSISWEYNRVRCDRTIAPHTFGLSCIRGRTPLRTANTLRKSYHVWASTNKSKLVPSNRLQHAGTYNLGNTPTEEQIFCCRDPLKT